MKKLIFVVLLLLVPCSFAQSTTLFTGDVGVSLNAVNTPTPGNPFNRTNFKNPNIWTWQVTTTGVPTTVEAKLMGTIDGSHWFMLDTTGTDDPIWGTNGVADADMRHVCNKPVSYIRCDLIKLSGGTAPTASCLIGSF